MSRCKDGAITNLLAERSCVSLKGRSYHEFAGRAFWWAAARTELLRIFWQRVLCGSLPGRSYHELAGSAFLFVAVQRSYYEVSGRTFESVPEDRAITSFEAKRCFRSQKRHSYHEFGSIIVLAGRCKDGAITNFLAERSCGSLEGRSYHEWSGRECLRIAVRAGRLRIFGQSVPRMALREELPRLF